MTSTTEALDERPPNREERRRRKRLPTPQRIGPLDPDAWHVGTRRWPKCWG